MLNRQQRLRHIIQVGSSFDDPRQFPEDVRGDAGLQLYRLQSGLEAADWRAVPQLKRGVEGIRLHHLSDTYRVIYLTRLVETIYALHCFDKKTWYTAEREKQIVRGRLQVIQQKHRSHK